jgi:ATP-dependent helicase HepA
VERRYRITSPHGPTKALAPTDLLAAELGGGLDKPGCYNRTAALRRRGDRIFRLGEPFVTGLYRLGQIDDRGQASAYWRVRREWQQEPAAFFGCEFLVEADVSGAVSRLPSSPGAASALRRRADGWFPPFTDGLWMPAFEREAVTNEHLVKLLNQPYDKHHGDVNLSYEQQPPLFELFGGYDDWVSACRLAESAALDQLRSQRALSQLCTNFAQAARTQVATEAAQARARSAASAIVGAVEGQFLPRDVGDALVDGILQPVLRPISVRVVVLSGRPPILPAAR